MTIAFIIIRIALEKWTGGSSPISWREDPEGLMNNSSTAPDEQR
jgi:hypothetical protein